MPSNYTFVSGDAGVHSFSATLKTAGKQSITVKDTVTATISGSQFGIIVNATAASQLKVSAVNPETAGTPFDVTVTAQDPYGNTAPTYAGTVHFTSSDGRATLPSDYSFTGNDAGKHTFAGGATLITTTSQSITATDTVTSTIAGKLTVTVIAAAASTLTVSGFTSPAVAGAAHTVTVTAKDVYGNKATGYRGTIHFTSTDSQAVLPADYTFTSSDNGSHSFTNGVTLKTAGTQSITATDTVTSSITGTQGTIKVNPAAATTLVVSGFPSPIAHGTAATFTVTALDPYGNVATGYLGTVHFTSSDTAALLPANYKFTSTDAGQRTFTATLNTTGTQSITATDTVTPTITGTESGIQVTAVLLEDVPRGKSLDFDESDEVIEVRDLSDDVGLLAPTVAMHSRSAENSTNNPAGWDCLTLAMFGSPEYPGDLSQEAGLPAGALVALAWTYSLTDNMDEKDNIKGRRTSKGKTKG